MDLDVHKDEHQSPWKYKFVLIFYEGTQWHLFTRDRKERSIWMQTFCRVLDFNRGVTAEESGKHSLAYSEQIAKENSRKKCYFDKEQAFKKVANEQQQQPANSAEDAIYESD